MIIFKRVLMTKEIAIMLADMNMYEDTYVDSALRTAYIGAQSGKRIILSGLVKPNIGCVLLVEYLNSCSFSVYVKPDKRGSRNADKLVEQFSNVLKYTIPSSPVTLQEPTTKLVRRHLRNWDDIDVDIVPNIVEG